MAALSPLTAKQERAALAVGSVAAKSADVADDDVQLVGVLTQEDKTAAARQAAITLDDATDTMYRDSNASPGPSVASAATIARPKATAAAAMGAASAATSVMSSNSLLKSAYELAREERIRQNEAQLRKLGLMDAKDALSAATAPPPKPAAAPKRKKPSTPSEPSRRSARARGAAPEYGEVADSSMELSHDDPVARREFDAARERRYQRLLERHEAEGLDLPETASYNHTVMRVTSMSEKALSNRVHAIERAAGSYAVIKMKQFAEVLILERHYDEVAKMADAALQRLLELPKFKGRNWQQMLEMAKKPTSGNTSKKKKKK